MFNLIKKNLLFLFILSFLFFLSSNILAQERVGGTSGGSLLTDPFKGATIFQILQSIIGFLIKIGAPILAVMVIYGGFLILSAGDNPEKVKSGKNVILWAVVGYVVVLCSWGVLYIIGQVITGEPEAFIPK
jgi:hypothetical protein